MYKDGEKVGFLGFGQDIERQVELLIPPYPAGQGYSIHAAPANESLDSFASTLFTIQGTPAFSLPN